MNTIWDLKIKNIWHKHTNTTTFHKHQHCSVIHVARSLTTQPIETMWGKTMSSFLWSESTESADICVAPPLAQTANTSLTDEAKVHLLVSQQRHRCQLTEIKSHKTSLTILRHNCRLFTRVVQCLCPPHTHTHTHLRSSVVALREYMTGESVYAQDARPRSISG